MKYFIALLLFISVSYGQYHQEASVLIDVSTYADSSLIASLPYRSVIAECAIVVDTSCVGVDSVLVRFANSQNVLARVGSGEITGNGRLFRSDEFVESKESVYLHIQGAATSGRIRVYIKWIEMY